jgi:hypothetical protein
MAAISLFWYTNMAAVTSDENDLLINFKRLHYPWQTAKNHIIPILFPATSPIYCKFRHAKTLFSNHHQNSVKTSPKSRKWHFRDSKFKIFLGLSALVFRPQSKRVSYGTASVMSVRKIFLFLFGNCVFISRIANTFVGSYAMKYSEIFFVIRKFLAYNSPKIPNQESRFPSGHTNVWKTWNTIWKTIHQKYIAYISRWRDLFWVRTMLNDDHCRHVRCTSSVLGVHIYGVLYKDKVLNINTTGYSKVHFKVIKS